jgi:hypothetical protein
MLLLDSPEGTMDAEYGNTFPYSLVMDQLDSQDPSSPIVQGTNIMEIGYRYRAYTLSNTAVLNSSDTLVTNMPDASGYRASLAASYGLMNEQQMLFSPEFLSDTSKSVVLNDHYLENGLDPVLKLHSGIPTFQQTFTDLGNSSDPSVNPWDTESGLIEHAPVSDYRENKRLHLYSDLNLVQSYTGYDMPLSTISDSRNIGIAVQMSEEYFPSREMRLNDYMDYISRQQSVLIPAVNPLDSADIAYLLGIHGSTTLKSVNRNWSQVPVGGLLVIGGHNYTVTACPNADTIVIHQPLSLATGKYGYVLSTEIAPQVSVLLRDVTRSILVDTSTGTPHSQQYSELGNTWGVPVSFPDPTPGPYPRNPGNPNHPTPTPPLLDKEIYSDSGATDLLLSASDADMLVKWRNWDQAVIVLSTRINSSVLPSSYPSARIRLDAAPVGGHYVLWDVEIRQLTDSGMVVVDTFQELS